MNNLMYSSLHMVCVEYLTSMLKTPILPSNGKLKIIRIVFLGYNYIIKWKMKLKNMINMA